MSLVAFSGSTLNPSLDNRNSHIPIFQYEYFAQHHISLSQIGLTNSNAFFLTTQGHLYYLPLSSLTQYLKSLYNPTKKQQVLEIPVPNLLTDEEDGQQKPHKWKQLRCSAEFVALLSHDGLFCQFILSESLKRYDLISWAKLHGLFCPSTFKEPFLDVYLSNTHIALRSKEYILLYEITKLSASSQSQNNFYYSYAKATFPTWFDNSKLQIENISMGNDIVFFMTQNGTVHVMAYENQYGITGVKSFSSKALYSNSKNSIISDLSVVTSQVTDFHLLPDEKIIQGSVSATSTHFLSNLGRVFVCGKDFVGLVMGEDLLDEHTPCVDRYWSNITHLQVALANPSYMSPCSALRKQFLCVGLNDQGQLFAYGNDSYSTFVSQHKSTRENWIVPKLLHFEHCIVKQFHLNSTQTMVVLWEPDIPSEKLSKFFDSASSLSDVQWNHWYLHKCILHARCPYLLLLLEQNVLNTYLEAIYDIKSDLHIQWKPIKSWQSTYTTRHINLIDTQVWYCLLQYLYTDSIKGAESFTAKQWNQLLWISDLFDSLQTQFVPIKEADYESKMIPILQKFLHSHSNTTTKIFSKSTLTSLSKCLVYCQEQLVLSKQTLASSDCTTFPMNISILWKNSCFADLELTIDKNKILVHKYILACQVAYFEALFVQSPFIESQQSSLSMNQHDEELTWQGLLYILEYLYCSHVTHINQNNVLYVLLQSGFLQCISLQKECERLAIPYLESSSIFKVMAIAEVYQANILLDGCYRWILDHWEAMYGSHEYEAEVTENCKYILETMARGEGKRMEKKIIKPQKVEQATVENSSVTLSSSTIPTTTRTTWLQKVKRWLHSQVHKDQLKEDLNNLEQL